MQKKNLDFIVNLDAFSFEMYQKIRGGTKEEFEKAKNAVSILSKKFPSRIFPQFTRMNQNEKELEKFFRFWHEKQSPSNGNVIIKKYDSFCGILSDERPADLSPLNRIPCWHQRRDMAILADGEVLMCRSSPKTKIANVLKTSVQNAWDCGSQIFEEHLKSLENEEFLGKNEVCRGCDEYYTFSF